MAYMVVGEFEVLPKQPVISIAVDRFVSTRITMLGRHLGQPRPAVALWRSGLKVQ